MNEDNIRDRLELDNGKVYWKKCDLYRWAPGRIRAGKAMNAGYRYIKFDGELIPEREIIELLTPECAHVTDPTVWRYIKDWGGDPDLPNGTYDCSHFECSICEEITDDMPEGWEEIFNPHY